MGISVRFSHKCRIILIKNISWTIFASQPIYIKRFHFRKLFAENRKVFFFQTQVRAQVEDLEFKSG